ncbi:KamA family radical SAM protein [candidate division KSB1 bacterium]
MEKIIANIQGELDTEIWKADSSLKEFFETSGDLEEARLRIFEYLDNLENQYFDKYSNEIYNSLHILERRNARKCIRVLKNIFSTENERLTKFSALKKLYQLALNRGNVLDTVSEGFLCEFLFMFRGINGNSGIVPNVKEELYNIDPREKAIKRSKHLDIYSNYMNSSFKKYKTGFDDDVLALRNELKYDILKFFGASESDWMNYKWHLRHIIKDIKTLSSLVYLNQDERYGLELAEKNGIPFQITPYYLSLFNKYGKSEFDYIIRAITLPSENYCTSVMQNLENGTGLDFMGEKLTSPVDCITRRYAQILILKPFNTCPQICVYCQRNWEVKGIDDSKISRSKIDHAIGWIRSNSSINEVLVTGGDPLTLNNSFMRSIIGELAEIEHVDRIRIGTRTLVNLPFRINDDFLEIIGKYHEYGKREICIVTHFDHAAEVTPDVIEAVKGIRNLGINIYNQQVFNYYNSRKFETCLLRKTLKLCGIDPYYSFNTKGKAETIDFRVPIARLLQERNEEARLLPGIVRTDEPVFNVPRLGKSHLRAEQDHEPVMILADGSRIYRFFPWESRLAAAKDYLYTDVSIYDYLSRLADDGEDVNDYSSIWYYY